MVCTELDRSKCTELDSRVQELGAAGIGDVALVMTWHGDVAPRPDDTGPVS